MNYTDDSFIILLIALIALTQLLHLYGEAGVRIKETILILCSWLIIITWGVSDLTIFLSIALFNFCVARSISRHRPLADKLLTTAIIIDMAILCSFLIHSLFGTLADTSDIKKEGVHLKIPLGISFYTFHIISYLVDLKKGQVKSLSLKNYLFYLSFFPHVISGPIVRTWQLVPQLGKIPARKLDMSRGLYLFVIGFALKSVFADSIAEGLNPLWEKEGSTDLLSALDYWSAAFLYYCQIYADFAGYSLMANGMARLLGYKFPANFRSPMVAAGFREFWRRGHITLSRWLRDYLYIPLGGNRHGLARTQANLMIVMLLGGLWHGIQWTFFLWGAMHGAGLLVEHCLIEKYGKVKGPWIVRWFVAQSLITVTFVFFRAPTIAYAFNFIAHMFNFSTGFSLSLPVQYLLPLTLFPIAHNVIPQLRWRLPHKHRGWVQGAITAFIFILESCIYTTNHNFIYFRF